MRSAVSTVLVVATSLLAAGFSAVVIGSWAIINWDGTGGANIGAGALMLLGTAAGTGGLLLATTALVLGIVHRSRSRARGRR